MAKNKKKKEKNYGNDIAPISNKFTINVPTKNDTKKTTKKTTKKEDKKETKKKTTKTEKNNTKEPVYFTKESGFGKSLYKEGALVSEEHTKDKDVYTYKNERITGKEKKKILNDKNINVEDRTYKSDIGNTWFKGGGFSDKKYNFGDISKTILATGTDTIGSVTKGFLNTAEGIADLATYGVSAGLKAVGATKKAKKVKEFAQKDLVSDLGLDRAGDVGNQLLGIYYQPKNAIKQIKNEGFKNAMMNGVDLAPVNEDIQKFKDEYSLLGNKTRSLSQGVGQVASMIVTGNVAGGAGLGEKGITAVTTAQTGLSATGSAMNEAYQSGATDKEAITYGLISGVAEAGSELMFGGLGKSANAIGVSKSAIPLDDALANSLTKWCKTTAGKNVINSLVKAGGEGIEEVVSGLAQAIGQKLTYKSEEEISDLIKDQDLLDQFIQGALVSEIAQAPSTVNATKQGKNIVTNRTINEDKVVEAETNNRVEEAEKEKGKKLTTKEINAIKEEVEEDLYKGYISTDTIEKTLGGEKFEELNKITEQKNKIQQEIDKMQKQADNNELSSLEEKQKLNDLKEEIKKIDDTEVRKQLRQDIYNKISKDFGLQESYNEISRQGEEIKLDTSNIENESQKQTLENAKNSKIFNDTNKSHALIDMLGKISADKGVVFDFTNNERLANSGFGVNGRNINGYVTDSGITINLNSSKAINKIVGHELTHTFEGTTLYTELQDNLKDFLGKEWNNKLEEYKDLYKGVKNANIENELTSDLIGDYLFTDENYVRNLSTKNKNLFQKIYDEIKYLYNVATAGSKEKRQLEKVKRTFDRIYNETKSKVTNDTKMSITEDSSLSLSEKSQRAVDELGTTNDLREAGYLLTDGQYLDFSGKRQGGSPGTRTMDHREISDIYTDEEYDAAEKKNPNMGTATAIMQDFQDEGNIRLMPEQGVDITVEPTAEQYDKLYDYIDFVKERNGEVFVDLETETKNRENLQYNSKISTRKIINDIKEHFNKNNENVRYSLSNSQKKYLEKTNNNEKLKEKEFYSLYSAHKIANTEKAPEIIKSIQENGFKPSAFSYGINLTPSYHSYIDGKPNINDIYAPKKGDYVLLVPENYVRNEPYSVKEGYKPRDFEIVQVERDYQPYYELYEKAYDKYMNNLNNKNVKYSISEDSQGRKLTENQKEYFKNSKVVDNNGNLKVMYNGGGDYTTFDNTKMSYQSKWGKGIYLTEDSDIANMYGNNVKEVYVDIENPINQTEKTISFDKYNKLVQELYDEEADRYDYDVYDNDLDLLWNVTNKGNWADYGEQLRNIVGVDGLIIEDSNPAERMVIAFNSNQIKNVNNQAPTSNADIRYDLSVSEANTTEDNEGRKLSKDQLNYFKDTKAVDNDGNLITVYHTTTDPIIQFNEFDPRGTEGYKFGDQVVNFYTNSKTMSGSYADYVYEMANTKKLNNIQEAIDFVENITGEKIKLQKGKSVLKGKEYYSLVNEYGDEYAYALSEEDLLRNVSSQLQRNYGNPANIQYEGYVNITNPYIIDAQEANWDEILTGYDELSVRYANEINQEDREKLIELAQISKEKVDEVYNRLEELYSESSDIVMLKARPEYLKKMKAEAKKKGISLDKQIEQRKQEIDKELEEIKSKQHFGDDYFRENVGELQDKINNELNTSYSDFDLYKMAINNFEESSLKDIFSSTSSTNGIIKDVLNQNKNGANYDGVIIRNVMDYGSTTEFDDTGAAQDVYVTFNSNQFKNVDNTSPTVDPDIRYSLSMDSQGRELSEGQQEYFKDSKVRDENGNLETVYHQTKNDFTEFKNGFSVRGFKNANFFTNQKPKQIFKNLMEGYVKIDNPLYLENTSIQQNIVDDAIANGYDGIINQNVQGIKGKNEIVTFSSNQFKNIDNLNPTDNPDIRYSLDIAPISKNLLTQAEQDELDGLRAVENSGFSELTSEEQSRMMELENKANKVLDKKAEKMLRSASYKAINTSTKIAENYLDFDANQKKSFRNQMREFSNMTKDELVGADTYNKVKDIVSQYANREYTYFDDSVEGIKRELKHTKIRVTDEMKNQITDYGYFVRDSKLMLRRNSGTPVDQVYQEYSEMYPNFFDSEVWSEADQLERLNDFMNHDFSVTEKYKLTDEDLRVATDLIYNKLLDNSLSQQDLIETEEILDKKVQKRTRTVVREELLNKMGITPELIQVGKDISAIDFARTDPIRVNEKVFGWKTGQLINDATVNFTKHQEAERMRFLNKERQEIKDLGIKARSKESELAQKYGEKQYVDKNNEVHPYTDEDLARDVPDIETRNKIKNAAREIRKKYDTYIDKFNEVITQFGYDEVQKRKDYMRHFVELNDKFSRWGLPFNPESMSAEDLPTDINGLTEFNRPGKSYFASANTRTGLQTTYDAITGIDGYLEGVSNLIYHTESIQRYRALTRFIRENYGREHGLDNIDLMTDEELAERIKDIQDNKLSKYVSWLDEQANSIAGKKGALDRSVERMFGRRIYTALNTLKSQVGSNMTGFNVRSAMTNFASAIQGASKTKKLALVKGTISTINNIIHNDGLIDKSDFLTRRFGSDSLALKPWQKLSQAGQIFMTGTDYFTANQIWRSKYFENLDKGMSETQAIKNADDFAARIMGDRSKGSTAELFNSKTLGFLSQFQLEVNNQWSSLVHDYKMDIQKGNKTALGVTFELGQLFAASYMFNTMMKSLTGSDVMIDPIDMLLKIFKPKDDDKDEGIVKRTQKVLGEFINQLPFANLITGGGRIPISEAFTGVKTLGTKLMGGTDNYGNEITWGDVSDDLKESLAYWVLPTGYGQIRKTVKGLSMYDDKLPIAGSYTDSGNLRFSAEDTPFGKVKAALFGQYSSKYAQDYIDSGYKSINASKLDEMKDLDMNSTEYRNYREGLSAAGTSIEDKLNYISDLDVSDEDKTIMASNVAKKDIDMAEYKKYGSYEEFNYAQKNPTKYEVMKLVGGYDTYKNYEKAINEITADYDRNGKAITNSRKNKVIKYVNSLNLTRAQKAMIIKEQYPSFTQYDSQIASYVNNQNISFIDKATILKQLGFKAYDKQIINYIRENYRTVEEQQEELEKLGFKIYNYNGRIYVR